MTCFAVILRTLARSISCKKRFFGFQPQNDANITPHPGLPQVGEGALFFVPFHTQEELGWGVIHYAKLLRPIPPFQSRKRSKYAALSLAALKLIACFSLFMSSRALPCNNTLHSTLTIRFLLFTFVGFFRLLKRLTFINVISKLLKCRFICINRCITAKTSAFACHNFD